MLSTSFDLFAGNSLLIIALVAGVLGVAMITAPFLGVGARRPEDTALESILRQIAEQGPVVERESFIGEIVDEPAPARTLALAGAR